MTEVMGLRLAYRGFVTGLAGAYVWLAVAMSLGSLLSGDALAALRPFASALVPAGGAVRELAFVLGFAGVQLGGGLVGMCFAYFFGRFFTVRLTLRVAAPLFALLAWGLIAAGLAQLVGSATLPLEFAPIAATLFYGLVLGLGLPTRREVLREAGRAQVASPVT
jgi:hypothetical protein